MRKFNILFQFLAFSILFLFLYPLHAATITTTTTVNGLPVSSGFWNSTTTWNTGTIPAVTDEVIITKGFTVFIDAPAPCRAISLSIEDYAGAQFVTGSTLAVSGDITFSKGANIYMNSSNPNDTFYLSASNLNITSLNSALNSTLSDAGSRVTISLAGDIQLSNDADFVITSNANTNVNITCRNIDVSNVAVVNNNFKVYINNPNSIFNLDASNITVGSNANFIIDTALNSTTSDTRLTANQITIDGTFDIRCLALSSTMTFTLGSYIVNKGTLRLIGANPSSNPKPDSENTRRNFILNGSYNVSYLQAYGTTDIEHVAISRIGKWRTADKYGICFFSLDGSVEQKFYLYNCDISSSADTGIYLTGCTKLNKSWYSQGISYCNVRNCIYNGVWFNSTSKSSVRNCKIYNNSGGNIGYGINLEDSDQNNIEDNDVYGNKIIGIFLENSKKNLIYNNTVHDQSPASGQEGIYLYNNSAKNVIVNNQCYRNPVHGIALEFGSNNNYLAANKCFTNGVGGMRVRYSANGNIFVANVSTGNIKTGLASLDSINTLCANEIFDRNGGGDIFIEGDASGGTISQIWLEDCLLNSTTEFTNTSQKPIFTKPNSWVMSQKHDNALGLTRIWGQFSMPQTAHTWHTSNTLKWNYADYLYNSKAHGWNTNIAQNDIPMLRYDDGGVDDGTQPSGTNDISSISTSLTTKTELWIVSFNASLNRWSVWGSSSGAQTNLVVPDGTDYSSDNGEIKFNLIHNHTPVSPGEEYVFVTIAAAKDDNVQKKVNLCDFSDTQYIGASFTNNTGATLDITGTQTNPTIITRKLAEDVVDSSFSYGLSLGGTINQIKYANFSYTDGNGLTLNSKPSQNTSNIRLENLIANTTTASYIKVNNISEHYLDNVYIETSSVTGLYNVSANASTIYFRDYARPFLNDNISANSKIYWDPVLDWSGLAGFSIDGVEPNDGERMISREFQIKYYDRGLAASGNAPTTVQVWIDLNDNGVYESAERIGMSKRLGPPADSNYDGKFDNGEIYYCMVTSINYTGDGRIAYRFYAENPYSITIPTCTYSLYSTYNTVLTTYEASGSPALISTFTVKGTPPNISIFTPSGDQTSLVNITYRLIDYDNKPEPYNYCSIKVEYKDSASGNWLPATRSIGSEDINNLIPAYYPGVQHTFVWNTIVDLPNKDVSTVVRITPTDEDGTGDPAVTGSFNVDNVIASKLVFATATQELLTGATSQNIQVKALDSAGNLDTDINGIDLSLLSNSTGYAFLSSTSSPVVAITQVNMSQGEATFKYRDNYRGSPTLIVSGGGLTPATQNWNVTDGVSIYGSSITVSNLNPTVGSSTPVNVTVTLRDTGGNTIDGKIVNIFIDNSSGVYVSQPVGTTSQGKATASIWAVKAGTVTIGATDVSDDNIVLASSVTVVFKPTDVNPDISTIKVSSTVATIGSTVTITAVFMDVYGNPVSGKTIRIDIDGRTPQDYLSNVTEVSGIYQAIFVGNTVGNKTIHITDLTDGLVLTSSSVVTYIFDIYPPTVQSFNPANGSIVTSAMTQISATLYDFGGSGVNLASTTVSLVKDGNTMPGYTRSTAGNTITLTFPQGVLISGSYTINATPVDNANNFGLTQTSSFTISIKLSDEVFKESVLLYPNPSNTGSVTVRYELLNSAAKVTLRIYTIMGELVREEQLNTAAGVNAYVWNCANTGSELVGTGLYIFKITAEEGANKYLVTKKQIIIKQQ